MNAHEVIDRLAKKSPGAKVLTALIVLVVLAATGFGLMYLGHRVFSGWADSEYLRERDEAMKKVAVLEASAEQHLAKEAELDKENTRLKAENQARMEAQAQADTAREQKALADQAKRDLERQDKHNEIDADPDINSQTCAVCREYASRGVKLSFCGKCEENQ